MLAWQQVSYVKLILGTASFLWQLHLSKCLIHFFFSKVEFMTFWAYAFDLITSLFKSWSVTNKLKKNNGLLSAGTSIFIPSFSLKWNPFKTRSAPEHLSFELPLLSSPSLELSSGRLLLFIVSEPWFSGFLSSALDWLSSGRLLLSDVTEPWFTESSSSALELWESRENLSYTSLRLRFPTHVLIPLFKQPSIVLTPLLKRRVVRIPVRNLHVFWQLVL